MFPSSLVRAMVNELKTEYGVEAATEELAVLELEDMKRKGCLLEDSTFECFHCSGRDNCPMNDWEKRHPEYANDELAMKIKVLEAGGEEAYRAKQKRMAEELDKATDADRIAAAQQLLNLYFKSKIHGTEAAYLEQVNQLLYAKKKSEIAKVLEDAVKFN